VQNYTQQYTYDEVGNILELQHITGTASYTRTYDIDQDSNRLLSTTVGANTYNYDYDARGNIVEMPHLDIMLWNVQNELHHIERGTSITDYQYSSGQRIRKYRDYGSEKEERIYLGNYEIYRKYDNTDTLIIERSTVHVSDDTGRIAMLEVRTFGTDPGPASLTRYIYSNHLQSASLELNDNAAIISYEEYHPYGTTSYQAMSTTINAVAKRYRYTGKERDEESGLYYHGARYYIPWLARWSASDPLESKYAGMSPYNYSFNNPVVWNDLSGMGPGDDLPPALATNDNNKIDIQTIDNQFPYLTPTGGYIYLPSTAEVTGTFDESPLLSDGIMLGQAVPGSVWTFSYQGESYLAQFEDSGKFIGYYSATNSSHFVNDALNTLPQLPESSVRTAMRHIEGGGKFLLGALGAAASATFAGASSPTGIGPLVGGAGVVYFSDVAASGFSQMVSGTSTPTYYQQSLSATGMSPGTVATVDFITGAALGMGTSSITSAPVYEFSNAAKTGEDLAFGLRSNLNEFSQATGFKNYRQFTSGGFQQGEIQAAIENSSNNLHFNLTDFSRYKYLKFDPAAPLSHGNITNWELHTIYNTPGALQRTTFYKFLNGSYQTVPKPF